MIRRKIAYRIYLATMRFEAMVWLKLRRVLLRAAGATIGETVNVFAHVFIDGCEALEIGNNVSLNRNCCVSAGGGLKIGDYVSIAHGTSILTESHGFSGAGPIQTQPIETAPVVIDRNVWIGCRAVILAGVHIAEGTIVGAGSVVTKSTEPYTTVAGAPANVVKRRTPPERASVFFSA